MKLNDHPSFKILFLCSYPPRECGIATYSYDLKQGLRQKFGSNCTIDICALESTFDHFSYPEEVKFILKVDQPAAYAALAKELNGAFGYDVLFIAHEFGLFGGHFGKDLLQFLRLNQTPIILNFHTVLPAPCPDRLEIVNELIALVDSVVCMTEASQQLLQNDYTCPANKCELIAHGTALVAQRNAQQLKIKLGLSGKRTLTTFGLLSRGKSIETALRAMALIKNSFPDFCYVVLGKTHPEIAKLEGEAYRNNLFELTRELGLTDNVHFVDAFVDNQLLEDYLQATDIYLFTSNDRNQAVSGTFAYAMACGCPIVSTAIPQASAALGKAGIVVDFDAPQQMAAAIKAIFNDEVLRKDMQQAAFQQSKPSAWPNVALKYMRIFEKINKQLKRNRHFEVPNYNLNHLKNCTTSIGLVQFCQAETPLLSSGYTLDDNARALIALVEYYALKPDYSVLKNIRIHFEFIERMQLSSGRFINYLDCNERPTSQNEKENLDDANGRAIWALGTFAASHHMFEPTYLEKVHFLMRKSYDMLGYIKSPRAIAFAIKGLVKYKALSQDSLLDALLSQMAKRLESLYLTHSSETHHWFEPQLTYANAVLPEALLLAAQNTANKNQEFLAHQGFQYLLQLLFEEGQLCVISNQTWYVPGQQKSTSAGQQPIDVAYTILALSTFYEHTSLKLYLEKMKLAFDWYQGNNTLNQIIYNPISGGCLDGIEATEVNINQGAESTVTYLMARNRMELHFQLEHNSTAIFNQSLYQNAKHDPFRIIQAPQSTSA